MLFNIIVIAVIAVPMAYLFIGGGSTIKKAKNVFKKQAADAGFNLNQIDNWQKGTIGIDTSKKVICYVSKVDNISEMAIIELANFSKGEVVKTHKRSVFHDKEELVIQDVFLVFKPKDAKSKEVKINFYNTDKTSTIQGDLTTALAWEKLVNGSF